ncbi:hypothetical protein ZPAH1_orf00052 [Aeromonas phage ZPAH1]|nr:hypothetical protein ZPAH1_orf00052 [Aeromonas phage ZPAH1]
MKYKFKSDEHYDKFMELICDEIKEGYQEARVVHDIFVQFTPDDEFEFGFLGSDVVQINGYTPFEDTSYFIMHGYEFVEYTTPVLYSVIEK